MAAGLPILASTARGSMDALVDGKSGYIFNPYDVDLYAKVIKELCECYKCTYNRYKNFNETYCNKFDIKSSLKAMRDIYMDNGFI